MLRATVLGMLGNAGHEPTIHEAKRRFHLYLQDKNSLSSDLAGVVLRQVVRHGTVEDYDRVVQIYENEESPEMKIKALSCISSPNTHDLVHRALSYGLTDKVRSQDLLYVFANAPSTVIGKNVTWEFVKTRWDDIKSALGGSFLLGRIVNCSSKNFTTKEKAQEVQEFFTQRSAPGIERTIQQTVEAIESNASFLERDRGRFHAYVQTVN